MSRRRVALVTGAARGIGRAIAVRLAAAGAAVGVNYLEHQAEAGAVAEEIQRAGGVAHPVRGDVSDPHSVDQMIGEVAAELGTVDILVNNAAIFPWSEWADIPVDQWDRVFRVNVRGPWLVSRLVVPDMTRNGWGRIVNIGSATALTGSPTLMDYAASKGAVLGFTRSLARAVGPDGITVNIVSTGKTITEGFEKFFADGHLDVEEARRSREGQPIPRLTEPQDVAAAVAFLASDDAEYITGQLINVDGGRNMY